MCSDFKKVPFLALWEDKIVMIDSNCTAWQLSMNNFGPVEKLLKLPMSEKYAGYGDANGNLYFIDAELRKPVTIFHPQTGQHFTIAKSNIGLVARQYYFDFSLIGNNVWLFSKMNTRMCMCVNWNSHSEAALQPFNVLWSHNKESFLKGPRLPDALFRSSHYDGIWSRFCYTHLNRSHVFFFAMTSDIYDPLEKKRVFLVDVLKEKWIEWPYLRYHDAYDGGFKGCSAIVTTEKNGKR